MRNTRRVAVLVALSVALVLGALGPAMAAAVDDPGGHVLAQNRERW
jgi:hypothetical protein